MEIADGIHRIETPLGERVNCVYLFVGTRLALLFDTAIGPVVSSHVEPYLAGVGAEPAQIRDPRSHIVVAGDAVLGNAVLEMSVLTAGGLAQRRSAEPHAHCFIRAPYGAFATADGYLILAVPRWPSSARCSPSPS